MSLEVSEGTAKEIKMLDFSGVEEIEILIGETGVVWVNVNGICRLRSQRHIRLMLIDERSPNGICDDAGKKTV